ncbi:MAG: DNA primase small subunit domain-containing protein [Candidatus Aenigmatarchaeota archaeon]
MEIVKNYYSNEKIQQFLIEFGKNREIVAVYKDGKYGKRPDILQYPSDIISKVEEGAIAFHCTAEKWKNPMLLKAGMTKKEYDELRLSWDLIIDVDVKNFEIAKIATKVIIEFLRSYQVKNILVKFTGGDSFHIVVPDKSFPEYFNKQPISFQYEELTKKLIEFIKQNTEEELRKTLIEYFSPKELVEAIGKPLNEIIENNVLKPYKIINLDVFGVRHLFRMPYSLHEKTLLVSLPINPKEILNFKKSDANPEKVVFDEDLIKFNYKNDAFYLLIEAVERIKLEVEKEIEELKEKAEVKTKRKIPFEYFPPCIKNILAGLEDGRNRSIFVLITFLKNVGYSWEEIEKILYEWNERNKPPLREGIIRTQLRWHMRQERNLLSPNCDHPVFYKDYGVCTPDEFCKQIKNPLAYALKKYLKEKKSKEK